ncbi:glycoside hydrolase family 10 protein [Deinococcus yavapaiensis]|uniref:glycoside hydrolase family 10 protein n=1 Tax=Deinococcus yavapaiensis TaxID=309889 RepID=UPI001474222E|nr:family 10 glycosylhydrolase [Deinococcus yavapaiensis]
MWVDAFGPGFKTPEQVSRLVADARKLGVNALFVQAGKRGDCYCDRASMPRTDDPEVSAGFDPLQDVIDKAHAVGIQVHAWITTTSVVNVPENPEPSQPDHVFNTHGLTASGDENWLMTRVDGEARAGNDYFLDPGHPDAAQYIREMYVSVAREYDVDGVQLDRVRYPDPAAGLQDWGYNPVSVARYQQETGATDVPAPADPRWTAWRRARVDDLVRAIHDGVKAVRPNAWVSAAVVTYGPGPRSVADFKATRAYVEVLQDWPSWLASGSVDLIVTMNYKRDSGAQAGWFDGWNRFAASVKGSGKVAAGTALYLNDERANVAQARRALSSNVDGWVGYSYRTPDAAVEAGRRSADSVWSSLGSKLTGGPLTGSPSWGTP